MRKCFELSRFVANDDDTNLSVSRVQIKMTYVMAFKILIILTNGYKSLFFYYEFLFRRGIILSYRKSAYF